MSIPPPLPPGQSRSEQMTDAFANRGVPSPSAPPPKQGMSGCAIAAIVGAAMLVFGVFIAGMLAAIAMPAYNDYLLRSKVASAERIVHDVQSMIDTHREQNGECPDNEALGMDDNMVFELPVQSGDRKERVTMHADEVESGRCSIELTFVNVDPQVNGKTVLFVSSDNGWQCDGGTLEAKFRSPRCRSGNASYNTPDNTASP